MMSKETQKMYDDLMVQHRARVEQAQAEVEQQKRDAGWVQDRKTGEWYIPQERFDQVMNTPEILAVLKRMADK
jgi:hypothetical protein